MNLPRRLFAPLARNGRFFADTVISGSHAASAALVAAGGADAAAIDCITFALLERSSGRSRAFAQFIRDES